MRSGPLTIKSQPCGEVLVRLRDVSLDDRLRGFQKLVREGMTEDEAQEMLDLILSPGDKGGRIAA